MSHFTVLVVTERKPTEDVLEEALGPFHEFECTGVADEYVQNVDQLAETRAEYESHMEHRLRDPEGGLHDPYEDRFYRDPTPEEEEEHKPLFGSGGGRGISWTSKDWGDGRGYRAKVRFVPEGWTEVQLPTPTVRTFAEFLEGWYGLDPVGPDEEPDLEDKHKYGWFRTDEAGEVVEVVDRTNPNKRWDWWQLGGRWSGMLQVKPGAAKIKGEPGLMGTQSDPNGVDAARKGDVDWDGMREAAVRERIEAVEQAIGKLCAVPVKVGAGASKDALDEANAILAVHGAAAHVWDATVAEWEALPEDKLRLYDWLKALPTDHPVGRSVRLGVHEALCGYFGGVGLPSNEPDPFGWARTAPTFTTHAFLRDGKWAEAGEMGFWGVVRDEKEDWSETFARLLADVPDDHWLAVVDCHI